MKSQPELEVVRVPVGSLRAYEGNAKRHTREQLDAVEASIKEFGFANPVLAWHDDRGEAVIIAGHGRVEAAKAKEAAERMEAGGLYAIGLSERERALVESLSRSAE